MSEFIKSFKLYQDTSIHISDDKKKYKELMDDFLISDLSELLKLSKNYNEDENSIQIHNFLDFIRDKDFISKIHGKEDNVVATLIKTIQNYEKKKNNQLLRYRLRVLLSDYSEFVTLEKIKLIFKIDVVKKCIPHLFVDYFREKNEKELYLESILLEFGKKDKDVRYYNIDEKDIEYLKKDKEMFLSFLEILSHKPGVIVSLLNQWDHKDYFSKEIVETIRKVNKMFLVGIRKLSKKEFKIIEKIVKSILNNYLKIDYSIEKHPWDIEDIFGNKLLQNIIFEINKKNPDFLIKSLDFVQKENKILYGSGMNFISFGVNKDNAEKFITHSMIHDRIILETYYNIENSNRKDKDVIISKLISMPKVKKIIDSNKIAVLDHKKKEKTRIEKQNNEVTKEINDICNKLIKESGYSEKIIYLYEKNPTFFSKENIDIVKQQIDKILKDKEYFNPSKGEIHRDEKTNNSFTRPSYMGHGTLERCIDIGEKLGLNINNYREKLVHYIPFVYQLEKILKYINNLEESDIKYLILSYSKERDKKDDLRLFHPHNLVTVFIKFQEILSTYKEFSGIFKEFLEETDSEKISIYLKKQVIDILCIYEKRKFFEDKLKDYPIENYNYYNDFLSGNIQDKKESNNYEVGVNINKILIKDFNDKKAINWRLEQLKNINVYEKEPVSGQVYGVTNMLGELWHGDSDFLKPLENIIYPGYKDDIIEILKKSFELDNSENNIAVSYLQKFVFEYFKRTPKKDENEAIQYMVEKIYGLNSGKFLKWYYPKLMKDRPKEKLEIQAEREKSFKIKSELNIVKEKYENTIKKLAIKDIVQVNNFVFVEGPTDKVVLEIAYKKLYPRRIMPFRILVMGGVALAKSLIAEQLDNTIIGCSYFWLFDRDSAGYEIGKTTCDFSQHIMKKRERDYKWIDRMYTKNTKEKDHFIVLLPPPKNSIFEKLIFKNGYMGPSGNDPFEGTFKGNCKLQIEHLLYFDGINDEMVPSGSKSYFVEEETVGGNNLLMFLGDGSKKKFVKGIQENHLSFPKSVWLNFKPIFDFIHSTIKIKK